MRGSRLMTRERTVTVSVPATADGLTGDGSADVVRDGVGVGVPAVGAAVTPGVLILKLTFDQRMTAGGFDVAPAAGAEAPDCLKTPRLLDDGKTFVRSPERKLMRSESLEYFDGEE